MTDPSLHRCTAFQKSFFPFEHLSQHRVLVSNSFYIFQCKTGNWDKDGMSEEELRPLDQIRSIKLQAAMMASMPISQRCGSPRCDSFGVPNSFESVSDPKFRQRTQRPWLALPFSERGKEVPVAQPVRCLCMSLWYCSAFSCVVDLNTVFLYFHADLGSDWLH